MTFTIMIATRDRMRDLEITCANLMRLDPPAEEVLICTDGCQDETRAMLDTKFPQFKVVENRMAEGSVGARARMLPLARGDVVISLDDDSHPAQPDFLLRLATAFIEHPEAAVVVFPELRKSGGFAADDKTTKSRGHYVSAYANCAAALRRGFYLERPGFLSFFEHMYEEPDYTLQCYAAGAAVWFEPSIVIAHRESSVNRDLRKRHQFNARNELWSVWLRCPWPWLPLVSAYRLARQFLYASSEGFDWASTEPCWWAAALKGLPRCWRNRRPISWSVYYAWLRLARNPIYSAQELREAFPPRVAKDEMLLDYARLDEEMD